MISEKYAKKYCCDDISNIENYELAINDTIQTWECHHRGEVLPCGRYTPKDLIKFGLYYSRPASELIFLTPDDHRQLHFKGVHRPDLKGVPKSEAHKKAISKAHKGVPLSEEHKKALSEALKGVPKSEDHKKAIREALSKKILQFTKSGEFIKEWPSAYGAERELGIAQSNICGCCKGKLKSVGGFIWMYK